MRYHLRALMSFILCSFLVGLLFVLFVLNKPVSFGEILTPSTNVMCLIILFHVMNKAQSILQKREESGRLGGIATRNMQLYIEIPPPNPTGLLFPPFSGRIAMTL
jgi:hypothetical protein